MKIGKHTGPAVYYHRSLLSDTVPSVQRTVIEAVRLLPAGIRWNIAKVFKKGESVSFLFYPDFDTVAHPTLSHGAKVNLTTKMVTCADYSWRSNPPILHRKELFVPLNYPHYAKFRKQTLKEESLGLLSNSDIGTKDGWAKVKREAKKLRQLTNRNPIIV